MATVSEPASNQNNKRSAAIDECEDVNKILTIVVKRRKTIPAKCMKINSQISAYEIQRLENAKVVSEGSVEKEKFAKLLNGFKNLKSFNFSLEDLYEAESRLEQRHKKTLIVNSYLEKRKKLQN